MSKKYNNENEQINLQTNIGAIATCSSLVRVHQNQMPGFRVH